MPSLALSSNQGPRKVIGGIGCAALLLAAVAAADAGPIQRSPDEVLLVCNTNSPTSTTIVNYYKQKRGITNVVAINCQDSALNRDNETIEVADYTSQIAGPISRYLAAHSGINFIVLTKGIPIRINGGLTGSESIGASPLQPSVDNYLAAIDYPTSGTAQKAKLEGSGAIGKAWVNRYYNASVPFTHAQFGGYLVTRLDGYTTADALALVDRALAAEAQPVAGSILLDVQPDFGVGHKTTKPLAVPLAKVTSEIAWSSWNADMLRAGDILEASDVPCHVEITRKFVGQEGNLLGCYSFGSNDSHFKAAAYHSLAFAPGAIGDTAVSTSARTFLTADGNGQSLVADLVAQGITGVAGYVEEPLLDAISSPTVDLTRYLSGYTLAESFYAGSKYVGWEGIILGDPLCCPFLSAPRALTTPIAAENFQRVTGGIQTEDCAESELDLAFIGDGAHAVYQDVDLTGTQSFAARVASADDTGGTIEIHLDHPGGTLLGTCAAPPTGDWQTWSTRTCNLVATASGVHKVCLVFVRGGFNLEWFAFRPGVVSQ